MKPDFSGYATKAGLKCSDGKTIVAHAFKNQDGMRVPLVWQHQHHSPSNVLGHAILENREDGVYAYGYFNDTEAARDAKEQIRHGDINALSIYANSLKIKTGGFVVHGMIREVSLVLAGANPGAFIDQVSFAHSDDFETEDSAVIYTDELLHADGDEEAPETPKKEGGDMTIADIYNTMNDDQKELTAFLVSEALELGVKHDYDDDDDDDDDDENETPHSEEGKELKHHNIFEGRSSGESLTHTFSDDQLDMIKRDFIKHGSLKDAVLSHAEEYGITNIDMLFPDAKALQSRPDFVKRRTEWVSKVLGGTHHSPFAKVKTMTADITHDEARAKGYIKGTLKKDEFFSLKSRTTGPTTIYKKQKLDRDDIIDVTDFDVVAWLKEEMRMMLEEELARAILFGDGREVDDPDKIKDPVGANEGTGIRSIIHDHEFYAHQLTYPANAGGEARIEAVLRSMNMYRGSGSPAYYTTRDEMTDLLLLKDRLGRRLYNNASELAQAMGVTEIVPVDVPLSDNVVGVVVNLKDYTIGTNAGGKTAFFDDFDIDYNQEKYLYETRLSGSLTKYKSALVIRRAAGTEVTPLAPGFEQETNTLTIPSTTGVEYLVNDEVQTGTVVITEDVVVEAQPTDGYYFSGNTTTIWEFTYQA